MSRIATNEYIGAKRRAYEASKPDKRRLILDDVCEMTGYSRKYANRLLTGNRKFKVRSLRTSRMRSYDAKRRTTALNSITALFDDSKNPV